MSTPDERIPVTQSTYDGIMACREDARYNMFAVRDIVRLASAFGYWEAADWIANNRETYARGIMLGFRVVDEP